jgi:hypothetical protein
MENHIGNASVVLTDLALATKLLHESLFYFLASSRNSINSALFASVIPTTFEGKVSKTMLMALSLYCFVHDNTYWVEH